MTHDHEHYADYIDECAGCGNLGYTLEINDEGEEYLDGCFDCFVAAHEKEAA